jgi:hypothetical protein
MELELYHNVPTSNKLWKSETTHRGQYSSLHMQIDRQNLTIILQDTKRPLRKVQRHPSAKMGLEKLGMITKQHIR